MQQVPWKEGRKCLIYVGRRLTEAVGCLVKGVEVWADHEGNTFLAEFEDTMLCPGQCPECFDVGGHAEGCIVGRNLKAGVPEFWARWARRGVPDVALLNDLDASAYVLVGMVMEDFPAGALAEITFGMSHNEWGAHGYAGKVGDNYCIALGPDGAPTTKPWEGKE